MPIDIDEAMQCFIRDHRVARLATADGKARPSVIPICYVFDGERLYTPIDEKPKSVEAGRLKRARNIEENPRAALVIDDYSETWGQLAYVMITGAAEIITPGPDNREHARAVELLRAKYPQYHSMKLEERPIIKITPARIKRWAPADGS